MRLFQHEKHGYRRLCARAGGPRGPKKALILLVVATLALAGWTPAAGASVVQGPSDTSQTPQTSKTGCQGKHARLRPGTVSVTPTGCEGGFVAYLVEIPNLESASLILLEKMTAALALGLLGAVATMSVARYYLSGITRGGGASEMLEGLAKTTLAFALIAVWPTLFDNGVGLANDASRAVLHMPGVSVGNGLNYAPTISLGSFLNIFGPQTLLWLAQLIISLGTMLALVFVLILKIAITATTAFLFAAVPVAIALWPIDELRWLTEMASKAATACLVVPMIWALLFAVIAVMGVPGESGPFSVASGDAWWASITQPVVQLALLVALFTVPRSLFKQASGSGGGSGLMRQTFSYAVAGGATRVMSSSVKWVRERRAQAPAGSGTTSLERRETEVTRTASSEPTGADMSASAGGPAVERTGVPLTGNGAGAADGGRGMLGTLLGQGRKTGAADLAASMDTLPGHGRARLKSVFDHHVGGAEGRGARAAGYQAFRGYIDECAAEPGLSTENRATLMGVRNARTSDLDRLFGASPPARSASRSGRGAARPDPGTLVAGSGGAATPGPQARAGDAKASGATLGDGNGATAGQQRARRERAASARANADAVLPPGVMRVVQAHYEHYLATGDSRAQAMNKIENYLAERAGEAGGAQTQEGRAWSGLAGAVSEIVGDRPSA